MVGAFFEEKTMILPEKRLHEDNHDADSAFDDTCRFIIMLGKAAHRYGVTTYRLESLLCQVSTALGMKGQFAVTPMSISFHFWGPP